MLVYKVLCVSVACAITHSQPIFKIKICIQSFFLTCFFMWSFSNVVSILERFDCCSVLSDGLVSGHVTGYPLQLYFHSRLLALSMKMAPFPQHHTAGTALTVKSVLMQIEVGKGSR